VLWGAGADRSLADLLAKLVDRHDGVGSLVRVDPK
jgi:hypothetical protein